MNDDEKLKQINDRLDEIDSEISRLSALKRKLKDAKEKLHDKKYLEERNSLAQNDWVAGKQTKFYLFSSLLTTLLHF